MDVSSSHGPSWTKSAFLAAPKSRADRRRAAKLVELHDSIDGSYYWFGQRPNGAIFLHPFGLRYSPASLFVNDSGELMGRGSWSAYRGLKYDNGFAELASYVGLDHRGPASGFAIAEFDVDEFWEVIARCAEAINRAP